MSERVVRWCRGLASLALLVGLVVGVPAALLVLGGNPLPRWDPAGVWDVLLRPDDGTVLARLLALVGWLAWVVFTLSLLVELANLLRRRSGTLVLPGLGAVQQWAAGLMLAVVALGGAAQLTATPAAPTAAVARAAPDLERPSAAVDVRVATSEPPRTVTEVSATAADGPDGGVEPLVTPIPAPRGSRDTVHVVAVGDDLWSLAERYYGRGQDWRRIAAANPDRLTGGPDRLVVGWRLVVPDAGHEDRPDAGATVRVRPGDTLSAVAERSLGDADRWRDLYRANRDQLSDPDELPVGLLLRLPQDGHDATAGSGHAEHRDRSDDGPARASGPTTTDRTGDAPDARATATPPAGPAAPASPAVRPTGPAPSAAASSAPAPTGVGPDAAPSSSSGAASAPVPGGVAPETEDADVDLLVPGLATVGGLLAAALTGGLAARRRWQLQRRPLGRRIAQPPPTTRPVEVALARRARPIGLRTLDRASRAVAASCTEAGLPVPALRSASVSQEWLVLSMSEPTPPAPRCFVDTGGGTWCLSADAVDGLRSVDGLAAASRPWPLLVTLGTGDDGAEQVVDLESLGLLAVPGPATAGTAVLAAMALELACSPWTEDLRLTLLGDDRLSPALAQHNVTTTDDVDGLLDRLERVQRERGSHADGRDARDLRTDPDLAEAWTPEVVLVDATLTEEQATRLLRLTTAVPGCGLTAVVRGEVPGAPATFLVAEDGGATLLPGGARLTPQTLPVEGLEPLVELVSATGSEETRPAPWWSSADPPEPPPDNVTYLGRRRRTDEDEQERRAAVQARITEAADGTARHPLLQLIGPVELLGAAGTPPSRAAKQCLEYCAWLLEHPGTTAQAMASGLLVAEGTRRSNMSRLRSWLGEGPDGEPYLPDAYSGRIRLDPVVSSDWHQLRLLVGDGVDRAPSSVLELGLRLVRGAPLADAAPVQWHWAEELRTDIVSCVRDIGVELARRSTEEGDLDLARWSAARALVAAPGDELLVAARIRTEHLAGNAAETERLCLQLAQQARALGADLRPETVDLIQEVMEGRVRARLA